ncbi:MAG TPA: DUF3987 domain-containing protein [Geminicoccus sp.]|uniref:DUF3987 domain-containing protein n=1 Tax=Geminicoccus sp. TaxID=2024832 RepID=UPI002E33874A|nr:DUF3987 domain-containing protein [Geminicoccus sp.]HEX2529427.1 DUF3987 domain-containing protein [Geminicoccus sp.]
MEQAVYKFPTKLFMLDEMSRVVRPMLSDDIKMQIQAKAATWLMTTFSSAGSMLPGMEYADARSAGRDDKERMRLDICEPCVSLLGFTVETSLWDNIGEAAVENGFLGRWLFFAAPSRIPYPCDGASTEPPSDALIAAAKAIRQGVTDHDYGLPDLAVAAPKPYSVPIEDDARAWIKDLVHRQVDLQNELSPTDLTQSVIARLAEQTQKLALIHAISADPAEPRITMKSVDWAYAVAVQSAEFLIGRVSGEIHRNAFDKVVKKTLSFVRRNGGKVDHSRLLRATPAKSSDFRDIVEYLKASHQLIERMEQGRTVYAIPGVK